MTDPETVELARMHVQQCLHTNRGQELEYSKQRTVMRAFEILYGIVMLGLPNTAVEKET